jgi:molybdopterin/thiamine biosynthesis adenylyltransferase
MTEDRYSRQVRFPGLGAPGQAALASANAVIVGCGALGSVAAELLVRAGVGSLTIIDRDYVELSNLQRQFLFDEQDAAEALPKAVAAERRLRKINSGIAVRGVVDDLRPRNATEMLQGVGVIVDATDNFETRFLINDYSISTGVPWIYGAAVGSYGITMPVLPGQTACFRCMYPERPGGAQPTCETAGVLGSVTAIVAGLQANMALQILSGSAAALRRKITSIDVWHGPLREVDMPQRDPDCLCCGQHQFDWLAGSHDSPVSLCGRNAVQIHSGTKLDLPELAERLRAEGVVRSNAFALRFFREPYEMTVFEDGRAILKGTTDVGVARSLYAKWIGA